VRCNTSNRAATGWIDDKPLELRSALIQYGSATDCAAHQRNIIHRDIKAERNRFRRKSKPKLLISAWRNSIEDRLNHQTGWPKSACLTEPRHAARLNKRGDQVIHRADSIFRPAFFYYANCSRESGRFKGKTVVEVRYAVMHQQPTFRFQKCAPTQCRRALRF